MLRNQMLPRLSTAAAACCRPRQATLRRPRSAIGLGGAFNSTAFSSTRPFQTLTSLPCPSLWDPRVGLGGGLNQDDNQHHHQHHQSSNHALQQVRWKRHSGNSGDQPKSRKPSKKQKKRVRRQQDRDIDLEKHSAPGSKAGPRRELAADTKQGLVDEYQARLDGSYYAAKLEANNPLTDPSLEYTQDDALLDDLVGNAGRSYLTSQPNPEPEYFGYRQRQFYNRVVDQVEVYKEELEALPAGRPAPKYLLPNDQEIAGALKAYRDQQGTRARPIGIAKALQHVLKDMGIPSTSVFGEFTFNALLSCCRTPKEGVRVFELMQQHAHEISAYSWAILVDVHAKVGDYEGAVRVLDEMHAAGHPPNMPAYTSVLAACYKVCNDGRIAHSIRAKAGKVGWEKWQELRINGLDPDAMCYGAMLRLCAARGLPEKAYNLLGEMPRFEVQPTTLCFTSALKAIAKSHETAVRYERGSSRKNKRRERIAAHHGKLARNVVMLAEQSHVEIDNGFVSALQLCAAAAGDSATAKALYLAHQVRENMKHWRQIGGEDHLARLRGEDPEDQSMTIGRSSSSALQIADTDASGSSAVARKHPKKKRKALTYEEREYGANDTRTLTAILRACAQASDATMIGTMWSGRDNYGMLDLASLQLIQQYRQPKMRNTDIPGMSRLEVGMGALVDLEDMQNPRKRTDPLLRKGARKKFPGMATLDDAGKGLDDLPGDMEDIFFDEDGMLRQKYVDSGLYPEYERIQENEAYLEAKEIAEEERLEQLEGALNGDIQMIESGNGHISSPEEAPMFFCSEERRWKTGIQEQKSPSPANTTTESSVVKATTEVEGEDVEWFFDSDASKWSTRPKVTPVTFNTSPVSSVDAPPSSDKSNDDWYFDSHEMKWMAGAAPQQQAEQPKLTDFEAKALERASQMAGRYDQMIDGDDDASTHMNEGAGELLTNSDGTFSDTNEEEGFQMFFSQLQQEIENSDEETNVDDSEARELYSMMRDEYAEEDPLEGSDVNPSALEVNAVQDSHEPLDGDDESIPTIARGRSATKEFGDIMSELKDDWGDDGLDIDVDDWGDDESVSSEIVPERMLAPEEAQKIDHAGVMHAVRKGKEGHQGDALATQTVDSYLQEHQQEGLPDDLYEDQELEELKQFLPGMPLARLQKVRDAYLEGLSDPSLLTLVPLLRERMPDWYTSKSIRKANVRSADFIMENAEKAGVVDIHLLNGMIQVQCAAGSLNKAIAAYDQFERYKLKPTVYTNRLVVQMFLKQRRLNRCLEFKQRVEEGGQKLDLLSYGSLIAHCSKHKQLGSAMMMLKECIAVNGAPPGENYLKQLRILCRREQVEEKVGLEAMIGEDPTAWFRHGEAVLKREYSKRGNRDLNLIKNAHVRG